MQPDQQKILFETKRDGRHFITQPNSSYLDDLLFYVLQITTCITI